ncbi:MAG: TetR/AcrR family transcriptional regulator [Pseudomonadota bacterium]
MARRDIGRSRTDRTDEGSGDALTPKQRERRRQILETVRRLIGDVGYASLTMRDVALEAGVAHATLYNQFETKDGLVLAALRDNLERLAAHRVSGRQDAIGRYFELLGAVTEEVVQRPRYAEAMTQLMFNAAPSDEVTNLLVAQRIALDRASVRQMIVEGVLLPDTNVDMAARRLTGAFWSIMLLWTKGFVALHDLPGELHGGHRAVLEALATGAGRVRLRV